jgi:hypothetical protein
MKIKITNMSNETIELTVEGNETIASIKQRIIKHKEDAYKYKDYEHSTDSDINRKLSFIKLIFIGKQLDDLITVQSYGIKDSDTLYYRGACPEETHFICSAPNISFEFTSYHPRQLDPNNIGGLKQYFLKALGSNCTISLKKVGTFNEYLELNDNESIPIRDLYIKFESELELEGKLDGVLHLPDFTDIALSNLKSCNTFFTCKEKSKTPYKYFIATGAIAALLGIVTTSYLFRNHLSESVMHSTAIQPSLEVKPLNVTPFAALGTIVGGAIGWVASFVYEYLNAKDTSNVKPNER